MKLIHQSGVVLACAALLALGACGNKSDDTTVGQKLDAAVAKTGEAAQEAKVDMKAAATEAKADMKEAAADAKVAITEGGEKMAVKIHDATITAEVNAGLAKDPDLSALKINVDTLEGKVTLKGPAPSTNARDRAGAIARSVMGVSAVDNQLVVKAS
jgi:hyperosmotically inducible protein